MGYALKIFYKLKKSVKMKNDGLLPENIIQIEENCENENAMGYSLKTFYKLEKAVKLKK